MTMLLRAILYSVGITLVACIAIGLLFQFAAGWLIDAVLDGVE